VGDAQTVRASTKKRKVPVEKSGHADGNLWRNGKRLQTGFSYFVMPGPSQASMFLSSQKNVNACPAVGRRSAG